MSISTKIGRYVRRLRKEERIDFLSCIHIHLIRLVAIAIRLVGWEMLVNPFNVKSKGKFLN